MKRPPALAASQLKGFRLSVLGNFEHVGGFVLAYFAQFGGSLFWVLVACQENRTFDEYFGYYPKAGGYGIPTGYYQPDGHGGKVYPYHFTSSSTSDISHSWQSIHSEWDNGAMDGFYTTDGTNAMGYYNGTDLPYYYWLANNFTLCGNYFCYQLGPTLPNRLAAFLHVRRGRWIL